MSSKVHALRLSIIIPTLNEAQTITALLDDLAPLRRLGHQLILVDGGSKDRTRDLADPGVDQVLSSSPGRAAQMNTGARHAQGDVLWFLHADTRVPEAAAVQLIHACSDGQQWGRFDISLSGSNRLLRMVERMMNLRSRLSGIATGDQGIFVRREVFEAVSGFPPISLMEDIALSKTLRQLTPPACIRHPRLLTSSRRWEQGGIIRTIILMWRLRLAYTLGATPQALAKRYQ